MQRRNNAQTQCSFGVKEKDSKRDDKYCSDIEALKQRYGAEFKSGVCIEIPLKEIINLCPENAEEPMLI